MSNEMEDLFRPLQSNTGLDRDESIMPMTSTKTNTLVASTLLESSQEVQSHTIKLFLDLIHKPDFDKSALTLHTTDEALAYPAHVRQLRASKRSDVPPATRQFPRSVVTNIIDIVESERSAHLSESQDAPDPVLSTLSDLSLVHRSWTWSAQKAIGRRLILATGRSEEDVPLSSLVRKAVISPLFGSWTYSVYIHDDSWKSTIQGMRGRSDQLEIVQILATLFKRLPRIRSLRLSADAFASSLTATSTLMPHLKALTSLRCLTLPDSNTSIFDATHRFVDMLHVASHLPRLISLKVGRWGLSLLLPIEGSEEHLRIVRKVEEVTTEQAPTTLKEISLTISTTTPLHIVSWLFDPYKNTNGSTARLERAHIVFENNDIADIFHARTQVPRHPGIMEYVSAISPAQSLKHITTLSLSITRSVIIPESAILSFLDASIQLRTLSIYHGQDVAVPSIIRALPSTLEEFTYKLDLTHDQFITFDGDVSREITAASFRVTHQTLRSISLSITEEFNISPVPTPSSNPYSLHRESLEEQVQAIKALPVPTIAYIHQACESAHIRLGFSYGRLAVSAGPSDNSRFASYASDAYRSPVMLITPVTVLP